MEGAGSEWGRRAEGEVRAFQRPLGEPGGELAASHEVKRGWAAARVAARCFSAAVMAARRDWWESCCWSL